MISTRRLLEMARSWKKAAISGRRRITVGRVQSTSQIDDSNKMPTSKSKGSFVVYTTDEKRFVVPLKYLNSPIINELFRISEDEFGLASNRPITFPCEAVLMEYILSVIHRRMHEDVEKALVFLMSSHLSSNSFLFPDITDVQMPICSF